MTIEQKKIKLLRKWQWDISRIYVHKFMKLFMNFLWFYSKTTWKNWAFQYFQYYHEFFMNCFQNYLEKLGLSIFPKLWLVSKTIWKFRPPQYFQVVLEMFPSSFGKVSCIENAFGTVYLDPGVYQQVLGFPFRFLFFVSRNTKQCETKKLFCEISLVSRNKKTAKFRFVSFRQW
jgi:hypothetical protein